MNTKKITVLSIALLSCIGIVGGVIALSSNNLTIKNDNSSGMLVVQNENNIKCLKVSNTEYQLTATVYPELNFNKFLTWTIEFNDPESEWASGKTVSDYVTIKTSETDQTICNVVFIKAFGEQMLVTCTSTNYPEIYATCTLDYEKKIKSIDTYITGKGEKETLTLKDGLALYGAYTLHSDEVYTINKQYINMPVTYKTGIEGQEADVTEISYDKTGKTINYSGVLNYFDDLIASFNHFNSNDLLTRITEDDNSDIFKSGVAQNDKSSFVTKLKTQTFVVHTYLYNEGELLFHKTNKFVINLIDVSSISLSETSVTF